MLQCIRFEDVFYAFAHQCSEAEYMEGMSARYHKFLAEVNPNLNKSASL
jgi:hypothetical protein